MNTAGINDKPSIAYWRDRCVPKIRSCNIGDEDRRAAEPRGSFITNWMEVRVLSGPPRTPIRTGVSWSLTNSAHFAGVSAGSRTGYASLPPVEVAIASILAPGLWALQTRSWRRSARIKSTNRASRIGATTQQEHRAGE